MPICKLCGKDAPKLAKCHIYPRSMSKELSGSDNFLVSMTANESPRSGYARDGIYDREIVCLSCEGKFKKADDYGILFRRTLVNPSSPCKYPYRTVSLPSFDADPVLLHQFAAQTWLRSALSARNEHSQTNDSELIALISKYVFDGKDTIDSGIGVAVVLMRTPKTKVLASPVRFVVDQYVMYWMLLSGMLLIIAGGSGDLPPGFQSVKIQRGNSVTAWQLPELIENEYSEKIALAYELNSTTVDSLFDAMPSKVR